MALSAFSAGGDPVAGGGPGLSEVGVGIREDPVAFL